MNGFSLALAFTLCGTPPTSSFVDIQRVLDAGRLRVAVLDADVPPMVMTSASGDLAGFDVDLARDIARKLGVEVEFSRVAETYDGVVAAVGRGEVDIGVSFLSSDAERALHTAFTRPYIRQKQRLFFNRARMVALRREHGLKNGWALLTSPHGQGQVGVLAGSIYDAAVLRDYPELKPRRYRNLGELLRAVRSGELAMGLHGELQVEFAMREEPQLAIYVGLDPRLTNPSDIRIAVRPDAPNLLRWLDLYLSTHWGQIDSAQVVREARASALPGRTR